MRGLIGGSGPALESDLQRGRVRLSAARARAGILRAPGRQAEGVAGVVRAGGGADRLQQGRQVAALGRQPAGVGVQVGLVGGGEGEAGVVEARGGGHGGGVEGGERQGRKRGAGLLGGGGARGVPGRRGRLAVQRLDALVQPAQDPRHGALVGDAAPLGLGGAVAIARLEVAHRALLPDEGGDALVPVGVVGDEHRGVDQLVQQRLHQRAPAATQERCRHRVREPAERRVGRDGDQAGVETARRQTLGCGLGPGRIEEALVRHAAHDREPEVRGTHLAGPGGHQRRHDPVAGPVRVGPILPPHVEAERAGVVQHRRHLGEGLAHVGRRGGIGQHLVDRARAAQQPELALREVGQVAAGEHHGREQSQRERARLRAHPRPRRRGARGAGRRRGLGGRRGGPRGARRRGPHRLRPRRARRVGAGGAGRGAGRRRRRRGRAGAGGGLARDVEAGPASARGVAAAGGAAAVRRPPARAGPAGDRDRAPAGLRDRRARDHGARSRGARRRARRPRRRPGARRGLRERRAGAGGARPRRGRRGRLRSRSDRGPRDPRERRRERPRARCSPSPARWRRWRRAASRWWWPT
jgi:hypothetical protein